MLEHAEEAAECAAAAAAKTTAINARMLPAIGTFPKSAALSRERRPSFCRADPSRPVLSRLLPDPDRIWPLALAMPRVFILLRLQQSHKRVRAPYKDDQG